MLSTLKRILMLASAIVISGWLSMQMTLPLGYTSPVWTLSGIAIAGLLIWGTQLWPGILLGTLISQLLTLSNYTDHFNIGLFFSSALTAISCTLQALCATWLSSKWVQKGVPRLDEPKSILIFFTITAPLTCVISSTFGIGGLVLLGVMPSNQALSAWKDWWIGDSLGVLIIMPLLFCLFAKPRHLWQPRLMTVALPLLAVLFGLILIFIAVFRAEQSRMQIVFNNHASNISKLLEGHADNVLESAVDLEDFFYASTHVERREFSMYTQSLLRRYPELQALEWLPKVKADALAEFEKSVQREGFPQFKVMELNKDHQLIPVQKRDEYYPVLYVEPLADNIQAFGFDSTSNSLSTQSKQLAYLTRQPSASQKLSLVQRTDNQPGVLISIPIFTNSKHTDSGILQGFVSAVVLPARMVDIALKDFDMGSLGIIIRDLDANTEDNYLYYKAAKNGVGHDFRLTPWQFEFNFANRIWQVIISPDSNFILENSSPLPWLTLIGGLFLTSLLSAFLLLISGRSALIEALVNQRTNELATANAELAASESKMRTLINSQPECIKLLAQDGSLLEMNPAGLAMIQANTMEQVKGAQVTKLLIPQYQQAFTELTQRVFMGESGTMQFEITGLKGRHLWMDSYMAPIHDSDGTIIAALGITRDITERKQTEDNLKLAARVFGEAHEGILITDAHANIIDVNPTFSEITGYSREEVIGKNPSILKSDKHPPGFYQEMWQKLLSGKHWQGEMWNQKKNGELYAELLTISALYDEDGTTLYYVGLFSDITESKQQVHMLKLLAHYDPLTGLLNRATFAEKLLQEIARSQQDNTLLAICFLDLDGFKPVNDQFGHETGDQILVSVAERIKSSVREQDSVCRYGGDEFVLLLGNIISVEHCVQAIEKIHQAIRQPFSIASQLVYIGVSSGLTIYPLDESDPDTLLRHADHAMYQAKLAGKNRLYVFNPDQDQQIIKRHNKLRDIENAFYENQFCVYFQPELDIKAGKVIGVEALIRWRHPEQGIILPGEFLPAISSTEMEITLGIWVMEQALAHIQNWLSQGLQLTVSVNISAFLLMEPDFLERVESILHKYPGVDSKFLHIEILESTAINDLEKIDRIVRACQDTLGIGISLDDFGTGYSSLTHLRRISVDAIKIDQSFVRDMLHDPDDYAIIEAVIGLSNAFRCEVIAEGVETEEQGLVLLLLGCHLLQGYSIARPMPADNLMEWLKHFQPYAEWQYYANAELSTEQIMMTIRRIDSRQWLQRIRENLFFGQESAHHWPILDGDQTHLGRWLKRLKHDGQNTEQWFESIEKLNRELHESAIVLVRHVDNNQPELAQVEFARLEAIHQQLDNLFVRYGKFAV